MLSEKSNFKNNSIMELYIVVNVEDNTIEFVGDGYHLCRYANGVQDEKIYGNAEDLARDFNTYDSYLRCYKYECDSVKFMLDMFSNKEISSAFTGSYEKLCKGGKQ